MDTSELMLAHIQQRISTLQLMIEAGEQRYENRTRLNELDMMLSVLRNANNLARLANRIDSNGSIDPPICEPCHLDPEITFEGVKPK